MSELAGAIQQLPMDEPPEPATAERARSLAAALREAQVDLESEAAALAGACARALEEAADRRVLFVHAVPLAVAAVELLGRPRPGGDAGAHWDRGLAGARYDIETILPGPVRPDVELSALSRSRRGPKSGTRG